MPGIYTHNYIFRRCVENVLKNRNRSYINRSIETLYSTPEHFKAGLFGAIGPNIFDYMHPFGRGNSYGSEISYSLHDRSCMTYLQHMTDIVMKNRDSRNEWSAVQRGYLYGYISHIISDAVLHPYIFYSSGFPDRMQRDEIRYWRRRNLRFQYNIDNYFLYRDESGAAINSVTEMIPVYSRRGRKAVWAPVKYLILESLRRENEALLIKSFPDLKGRRIDGDTGHVKNFDRIAAAIPLCYRIKRTENIRWINLIDRLADNSLTYSDFFIRYPLPKRVDDDALNTHQGRWQYPAHQRGFRYESIFHLIKFSIEQIVSVWELMEPSIYEAKELDMNRIVGTSSYTGEKDVFFEEMKIKDPVRLKV